MPLSRGKRLAIIRNNLPTNIITYERKKRSSDVPLAMEEPPFTRKIKSEVYGEEMIDKEVKQSGNGGRVLPDCANASFCPGF